jgi:hypothetical protein
VSGGAFDAREVALRVRAAWEAPPPEKRIPAKQLIEAMGLKSASAWTKRINPDDADWVPFRIDELSVIAPMLAPRDPWRFLLDKTETRLLRQALDRAEQAAPPAADAAPPGDNVIPSGASSIDAAQPGKRKGGAGGGGQHR